MEFLKKVYTETEAVGQKNLTVYKIENDGQILIKKGTATKVIFNDGKVHYYDIKGSIVGSGDGTAGAAPTTQIPLIQNAKIIEVGSDVTVIGHHAFAALYPAKPINVILSNGITEIGECAFMGNITINQIPSTVQTLGRGVFAFGGAIKNIVIPEGISSLYDTFFSNTSVEQISLPITLRSVRNGTDGTFVGTFYGLNNLKKINYNGTLSDFKKITNISALTTWGKAYDREMHIGTPLTTPIICLDQTITLSELLNMIEE